MALYIGGMQVYINSFMAAANVTAPEWKAWPLHKWPVHARTTAGAGNAAKGSGGK